MKTVATYSVKGGVGKTTSAVNLAWEAAAAGCRVLLWDLDPQGAATFFFRVKPEVRGGVRRVVRLKTPLGDHVRATDVPGLHLVPADFSLRHLDLHLNDVARPTEHVGALLGPLGQDYDVTIVDCPAGVSLTSESVVGSVDALLVPTIPTTLSVRTLDQLDDLADAVDAPRTAPAIMPFISMLDRRKKLHRDMAVSLAASASGFLRTAIPNASAVERMGVERAPLAEFAPRSAAAVAFAELWREIAERLVAVTV